MKTKNNKSGFTLLEIIIVIIIVGVLASLALPRFFETVEFSRSTEAMAYIGAIKRGLETCALMSGSEDWQGCDSVEKSGHAATPANAHFTYAVDDTGVTGATTGTLTIEATRTALNNSGTPGDNITFVLNIATSAITRSGTTAFERIN